MNIGDLFPGRYLRASDVTRPVTVAISGVRVEDVVRAGDPGDEKPVLFFEQGKRALVLNKTNAEVLQRALGDETDLWVGKEITLYPTETDLRGQRVPCIRIRVDKPLAIESGQDSDLDDIPF
jgi:hypothetical protein